MQLPLDIVHVKEFAPDCKPVTKVFLSVELSIIAEPDVVQNASSPTLAADAFKFSELKHVSKSAPA